VSVAIRAGFVILLPPSQNVGEVCEKSLLSNTLAYSDPGDSDEAKNFGMIFTISKSSITATYRWMKVGWSFIKLFAAVITCLSLEFCKGLHSGRLRPGSQTLD